MFLIFILKFIFDVIIIAAQGNENTNTPQVLCQFQGQRSGSSYKFDISDVSERCTFIIYGYYLLDGNFNSEYSVLPSDEMALKELMKADKNVYIMVGFNNGDELCNIFYPPDENLFTIMRNKLIRFLNAYNIVGIILEKSKIYDGPTDLAEKINSFAREIKCLEISDLKVGLIIGGEWYTYFSRNDLFNYTITNANVDLYIIDTTTVNECTPETKISGVLPVSGNNNNLISLDQMCDAAYSLSYMDKSKIYVRLLVGVRRPTLYGEVYTPAAYSEYCDCLHRENGISSQWCADTSKMLYEKGQYVKQKKFRGIVLSQLGFDDYSNTCECERFSVTNKIIDGWECRSFQECEKIDHS